MYDLSGNWVVSHPPPQVKKVKQSTAMALLDGPGSIPRIHVVANNCHSGPNALFWSLQVLHAHGAQTNIRQNTHTHKTKANLKIIKMTKLNHSNQISKKIIELSIIKS